MATPEEQLRVDPPSTTRTPPPMAARRTPTHTVLSAPQRKQLQLVEHALSEWHKDEYVRRENFQSEAYNFETLNQFNRVANGFVDSVEQAQVLLRSAFINFPTIFGEREKRRGWKLKVLFRPFAKLLNNPQCEKRRGLVAKAFEKGLIPDNNAVLYLGTGTTTYLLADALLSLPSPEHRPSILTPNFEVINRLYMKGYVEPDPAQIQLFAPGLKLDWQTGSLHHCDTPAIDTAIIGVDRIDKGANCYSRDLDTLDITQESISQAMRRIVVFAEESKVADDSGFGKAGNKSFKFPRDKVTVITDVPLPIEFPDDMSIISLSSPSDDTEDA